MLKACRCVIVAVAGWLALAGQHPNPLPKAAEYQANRRVGDASTNIAELNRDEAKRAERSAERQPCEANRDNRKSDLCAQWKAADAAADAAWWAAISGVLSVAGLIGVAGALRLTVQSNKLARASIRASNRPWLDVEVALDPEDTFKWTDQAEIVLLISSNNYGATPATNIECSALVSSTSHEFHDASRSAIRCAQDPNRFFPATAFPGETIKPQIWELMFDPDKQSEERCEIKPTVFAYVGYDSTFGEKRSATVRIYEVRHKTGRMIRKKECPIRNDLLQLRECAQTGGYVS